MKSTEQRLSNLSFFSLALSISTRNVQELFSSGYIILSLSSSFFFFYSLLFLPSFFLVTYSSLYQMKFQVEESSLDVNTQMLTSALLNVMLLLSPFFLPPNLEALPLPVLYLSFEISLSLSLSLTHSLSLSPTHSLSGVLPSLVTKSCSFLRKQIFNPFS